MNAPEKAEEEDYDKMKEDLELEIAGQNVGISVFKHIISRYRSRRFEIPTSLLLDWVCGDEVDPNYNVFKKKIDGNRRYHREELVIEVSKNESIEKEIKQVIEKYEKQLNRHAAMEKKRKKYHQNLEELIYELSFIYCNLLQCFIDKLTGYLGDEWRNCDAQIYDTYEKDTLEENRILIPFLATQIESDDETTQTEERKAIELTPSIYPEVRSEDLNATIERTFTGCPTVPSSILASSSINLNEVKKTMPEKEPTAFLP